MVSMHRRTIGRRRAVAAGMILAGGALSAAAPQPAHAAAGMAFSHQVVVDEQRPGFEPDIKVAPDGSIYSSVPFGFSTTASFLWASRDSGNSYQLTPGNVGIGKPSTCVGGGDTDLLVDPGGELYFSDLQGLTNISQSASADGGTTWSTNCAGVPNAPVDRMWFTSTGTLAGGNLNLYEDYDAVGSAIPSTNNELVETVSHNGLTFLPVVNATPGTNCTGAGLANCVTDNEGISGNQVVDPVSGNLYISHTDPKSSGVFVSEGLVAPGAVPTTTQATWKESPILDASLCHDPTCLTAAGNPEGIAGENFASIARDSAGYLYVAFTFSPIANPDSTTPAQSAPEAIYVVHSLQPATMADPSTVTWSAPLNISKNQTTPGTDVFPWITAGSDGRVEVAWYHADQTTQGGAFGAPALTSAEWGVQLGQSINAHDAAPSYSVATVTEHPVKNGPICTSGLGCTTGGDRSLGDFLQVTTDNQGAALVSYVDDTSADTANGENAGPTEISHQISGPSLLASVGTISGAGSGPATPTDTVTDPAGDAFYSANGSRTPAGDNLDLTGASLTDGPNSTLVGTIDVKSLASLSASPTVGGPDASWILRWTQVTPGQVGNGHIYYAGMDSNGAGSGTPSFFVGDTSCVPPPGNPADHCKLMTFPQTTALTSSQASYNATTGVITFTIPLSAVGSPAVGTTLYSVTAFSATSLVPQSAVTPFNLTDATTPFDHTIGTVTTSTGTAGSTGTGTGTGGVPVPSTGAPVGSWLLLGAGALLLAGTARVGRRRRN